MQPNLWSPRPGAGFFMLMSGGHARTNGEIPMALERTLSIIKPDAVAKNVIGEIYARFEKAGLKIVAAKRAAVARRSRRLLRRAPRASVLQGAGRVHDLRPGA
jgi:hypothetical protein